MNPRIAIRNLSLASSGIDGMQMQSGSPALLYSTYALSPRSMTGMLRATSIETTFLIASRNLVISLTEVFFMTYP